MVIRRIIRLFVFCLLTATLFSCFEIKESIHLNKNGSGTYSFLMDLSQMKPLFSMSRDFKRSMGDSSSSVKNNAMENPMIQMKVKFDALKSTLESSGGISDYQTICDTSLFIIGASYRFENIESLNNSINILRNSSGNAGALQTTHYVYDHKHFEKVHDISKANIGGSASKNDSLARQLFNGARYTLTCTFESKIKDVSNPLYFISADGKTLLYSGSLLDIMDQKANISNKVVLQ